MHKRKEYNIIPAKGDSVYLVIKNFTIDDNLQIKCSTDSQLFDTAEKAAVALLERIRREN